MQVEFDIASWRDFVNGLLRRVNHGQETTPEIYLDLAGLRTVRVIVHDSAAMKLIRRELNWVITAPVPCPDATIVLWREDDINVFLNEMFGISALPDDDKEYLGIKVLQPVTDQSAPPDLIGTYIPMGQVNITNRNIYIADGTTYYIGTESYEPDRWLKDGHVFVQVLFRILNEVPDASLVHGACLGLDGSGLLMCARGNRGKSTLTVTALLHGFEYVSEDYLILQREGNGLTASPLYSIITLSPKMYDALYDDFGKARFVGVSSWKGKYVFDITDYGESLRKHYPVRACLFPEIDLEAKTPVIEKCNPFEKNRAITHMAHSTMFQMWNRGLKQDQQDSETILKIIGLIRHLIFYKMTLTPDIFANVECLREFMKSEAIADGHIA